MKRVAEEKVQGIAINLKKHVSTLAGDIGERNMWHYENLRASESFITESLPFDLLTEEVECIYLKNPAHWIKISN